MTPPSGQTTLADYASFDPDDPDGADDLDPDERLDAVVDVLDRQMDVLEEVVDAAALGSADTPSAAAGDDEPVDHAGRGIW